MCPARRPERSIAASFAYPFREAPAVALLLILPPMLWLGGCMFGAIVPLILSGSPAAVLGLAMSPPLLLLFGVLLGHVFVFLGDVAVSSCLGEAGQPRPASWLPGDLVAAWGRWTWALLAGCCLGGLPACLYWVEAGDIDWFDRIVLIDLALPGVAYGLMALILTLVRETPWAAVNPVLVARSLVRAGWGYVGPCLVGAGTLLVSGALIRWCTELRSPAAQAGVFYLWWCVTLYLGMVTLRVLGLHCHRSKAIDL